MKSEDIIDLPHLRRLIGLRVRHQGVPCVVVEVLDEPPALVLEPAQAPTLMANFHGDPGEYAVETRVIRVLTDDNRALSDALLDLELLD